KCDVDLILFVGGRNNKERNKYAMREWLPVFHFPEGGISGCRYALLFYYYNRFYRSLRSIKLSVSLLSAGVMFL
ncbi:TPA: hypothetical protein ACJVS1_004270, partial [Salmonella enterica subsp. enterica serovar Montevideo]